MVVEKYREREKRVIGEMGVIGKKRINYERIVKMVEYKEKIV